MTQRTITPKYMTVNLANAAVNVALRAVMNDGAPLRPLLKRRCCHIVILVPGRKSTQDEDYPSWPECEIVPVCLYEHNVDPLNWEGPYQRIARSKATQLWYDLNDEKPGVTSHLVCSGDTVYWGGVKRHGFVVTCSGVQPGFDQLISGIIADTLKALSNHEFDLDPQRVDQDFIP